MKTEIKLKSTSETTYECGRFTITNVGASGTGHGLNLWSVTSTDSGYTWNFNTLKEVRTFIAQATIDPKELTTKQKSIIAFNRLRNLKFPVFTGHEGDAEFLLSAEISGPNNMPCCFYNMEMFKDADSPGVDPRITDILDQFGLYAEWQNPAVLGIYLS